MEKQTAMHIVQTLAQGIDPHTGEQFPPESPYQHPDTVRALIQAAQALAEPAVRTRPSPASPPLNAGKPWSETEDQALTGAFDAGATLPALAEQHQRSRAAIQARLIRLGKLEPTEGPRFRITPISVAQAAP